MKWFNTLVANVKTTGSKVKAKLFKKKEVKDTRTEIEKEIDSIVSTMHDMPVDTDYERYAKQVGLLSDAQSKMDEAKAKMVEAEAKAHPKAAREKISPNTALLVAGSVVCTAAVLAVESDMFGINAIVNSKALPIAGRLMKK